MTLKHADIAIDDAEGFSLAEAELREFLQPLMPRFGIGSVSPVLAAFASRADLDEGLDGGLGLLALVECVLNRSASHRFRDALNGGEHASGAFGMASVIRQATRRTFSVLIVSDWRSLSDDPSGALDVFDRLAACGVTVFVARNGCVDRESLRQLVLLGGPTCGSA